MEERPAWSAQFAPDALQTITPVVPLDEITAEWAWGGSSGAGVKVAVIDSGIDADHEAVGGGISGYVAKILGKHPGLTLFQMKTVLRALSANMPHR